MNVLGADVNNAVAEMGCVEKMRRRGGGGGDREGEGDVERDPVDFVWNGSRETEIPRCIFE